MIETIEHYTVGAFEDASGGSVKFSDTAGSVRRPAPPTLGQPQRRNRARRSLAS